MYGEVVRIVSRKIVDLEMAVVLENNDNLLCAMLLFQNASPIAWFESNFLEIPGKI